MVRPASWRFGGIPGRTPDERLDLLAERLQDLESLVDSVHRDLAFGPLDSQYLPITLGADYPATTALPNGTLDRFTFPFEANIVLVQLYCLGGDTTIEIESQSISIFQSGPILLPGLPGGSSIYFNQSTSFSGTGRVSSDLTLRKVSTVSSTPHRIHVRIFLKNVSSIEPT